MANGEMIAIQEYCVAHDIEVSFVDELCDAGLLEITRVNDAVFISYDHLPDLERLARWHYEMDINLEGIETINHLLQQMKTMQHQLRAVRTRLSIYENIDDL